MIFFFFPFLDISGYQKNKKRMKNNSVKDIFF